MPPEILNQTMNFSSFQCYKMADVYSASLILYEILSCVKFDKGRLCFEQRIGDCATQLVCATQQTENKQVCKLTLIISLPSGAINKHTMPYNNHLPSDPTIEEVKEVVCAGIRPDLGFLGNQVKGRLNIASFSWGWIT